MKRKILFSFFIVSLILSTTVLHANVVIGNASIKSCILSLVEVLTNTFISVDTNSHQGYTTDGTSHYTIDTSILYKRDNDSTWTIDVQNNNPIDGLGEINHLGDGSYYNNTLYIVAEKYNGDSDFGSESILTFQSSDLSRTGVFDISEESYEASGCVVVSSHGDNGIIYVVSYVLGTSIWKYDLSDYSYLGKITLDTSLSRIQGIAYKNGYFYLSTNDGGIHKVNIVGECQQILSNTTSGSHEGVDYSQDELRWMIDDGEHEQVYFYE